MKPGGSSVAWLGIMRGGQSTAPHDSPCPHPTVIWTLPSLITLQGQTSRAAFLMVRAGRVGEAVAEWLSCRTP